MGLPTIIGVGLMVVSILACVRGFHRKACLGLQQPVLRPPSQRDTVNFLWSAWTPRPWRIGCLQSTAGNETARIEGKEGWKRREAVRRVKKALNVLSPVIGIALMLYYSVCDTSCSNLAGSIFYVDLKYAGVAFMVAMLCLAIPYDKTPFSKTRPNTSTPYSHRRTTSA